MEEIHISRLHFPVTTLGPGRRVGIWFQGCTIRCNGCIAVDTWQQNTGQTAVESVIDLVGQWSNDADGITITGGEPFDQSSALIALLRMLEKLRVRDVLVYTGYSRVDVQDTLEQVDGLIDALVSEQYDAQATDKLSLRGSDNQILHLLTTKGVQRFEQYNRELPTSHALDAMFDEDGTVWLCGIPKRNDLSRLQALLDLQGHRAVFTQQDAKRKT